MMLKIKLTAPENECGKRAAVSLSLKLHGRVLSTSLMWKWSFSARGEAVLQILSFFCSIPKQPKGRDDEAKSQDFSN